MATDPEHGGRLSPIDGIRSLDDLERLIESTGGELVRLRFGALFLGIHTPETEEQLLASTANLTVAAQSLTEARALERSHRRRVT